ncbi:FG-GAP-like repeat-containing protein [Chryseolinea lacunae]|uniref:VCBS repeat-containing protein n=1 Tax=Chryseolinea lacunae TaxID=2801331 RepID=A0ABS1KYK5_9BACT|nr:FG-GAP-like repeat-containing protein [Chryseolinea lacunae]MBL0743782.1 VCBS repeat-containing protein [Chryseolinea lacunae]
MKSTLSLFALVIVVANMLLSCNSQDQKEEQLARQYCGSCHMFPEPSLLPKKTWEKDVMPQMALRMGIEYGKLTELPDEDRAMVLSSLPLSPMVSDAEWKAIQNYFQKNAPDSVIVEKLPTPAAITQFDVTALPLPIEGHPTTSMLAADTAHQTIFLSDRRARLHQFDEHLNLTATFQMSSPAAQMLFAPNADPELVEMGIMDPNDQAKGAIVRWNGEKIFTPLIDSVQRPVFAERADLNNDGQLDYVVCAFGNFTGSLAVYEAKTNGAFTRHVLQNMPGARKVVVRDFDNNGMPDILALMTQGDERLVLFLNQGNFRFRINVLLRFPPTHGSSYFDLADFNNDGKADILFTNGDNADYSPILKPYHRVAIYLNDGANHFTESWSYPLQGATQARAIDFDKDGDLDVAAIAFFPDFENSPEQGFVYFEKTPEGYTPYVTPLASQGRWITMEVADIDRDNDDDILLGALDFYSGVPKPVNSGWMKSDVWLLMLRNRLH